MAESVTEPKTHLALDTDWRTAVSMASLLLVCALLTISRVRQILHGHWSPGRLVWQTWVVLAMCAWCAIRVRERRVQIVCLLVAVGPASRVLLWLAHASIETQLANAAFTQTIGGFLFLGTCIYVVWWFKSKIRHV